MNLTSEQQRAIDNGEAVEVTVDGKKYAMLQWEIFQKMKGLVEYDDAIWSKEEKEALLKSFGQKAGWDDPELDVYEQYRP